MIEQAIASLPAEWQAGHRDGDAPGEVVRRMVVRADTADGTSKVTAGLAARNIVFSVGMRTSEVAAAIIADIHEAPVGPRDQHRRSAARRCPGRRGPRVGAGLGPGRHPRDRAPGASSPGCHLRLRDYNGLRHQVTLTNDRDGDLVELERGHRAHAQVENRIKNLKDTGLGRLPFSDYNANRAWVELNRPRFDAASL